ncbi:DUF58 domain-containing protein [Bhargavaea ullalensis]|uniref:Uncharacterized protein (DUF58 family) n=1 Tax=Bhargavaea ullalensis TaxID=1265685 RepID=A0ABV2GAM7_9BACL
MSGQFHLKVHAERRALAVSLAAVVFLLVALFGKNPLVWSLPLSILLVVIGNYAYVFRAARNIRFRNERTVLRLFPGDEGRLLFSFTNAGRLPVLSASWSAELLDRDGALGGNGKGPDEYRPLLLLGRETAVFPLDVLAAKRGFARYPVLKVSVRDLLGLYTIWLTYTGYVRKEICVYPELRPFQLPARLSRLEPGASPERMSLFEEPTMPRGSRTYRQGDPFGSVAWKETARTGELRTKEFERVVLTRWILAANLPGDRSGQPGERQTEKIFGEIAFAMSVAEKRGIETEVWLNVRMAGARSYLRVPAGLGPSHFTSVLQTLARLPASATVADPTNMYGGISKVAGKGHVLLHFGEAAESAAGMERLLRRKGVPVHLIKPEREVEAG